MDMKAPTEQVKTKVAKSDGYARVKIYPASGADPVEIHRKIVAGTAVPAQLVGEHVELPEGVEDAENEVTRKDRTYTRAGQIEPGRDRSEDDVQVAAADADELASARPARGRRSLPKAEQKEENQG